MDVPVKPILWIYREVLENEHNYVIGEHEVINISTGDYLGQ
ncbi:hypothetical protein [Mucilaginibacter flavus]|nr:hypothetical protein [Mucilaginibacter flavus]